MTTFSGVCVATKDINFKRSKKYFKRKLVKNKHLSWAEGPTHTPVEQLDIKHLLIHSGHIILVYYITIHISWIIHDKLLHLCDGNNHGYCRIPEIEYNHLNIMVFTE